MMFGDHTDDPFWRARTEDANGRIHRATRLPDAERWRALRLGVDLMDLLYGRSGLGLRPVGSAGGDAAHFELVTTDCARAGRTLGSLDRLTFPDGCSWPHLVEQACQELGLDRLANESGHGRCRHAQTRAVAPLMWRIALLLHSAGGDPVIEPRPLRALSFAEASELVGPATGLAGAFDRDCRWYVVRVGDRWVGLTATGRAYLADFVFDLAAMYDRGLTPGELATVVEERMTGSSGGSKFYVSRMAAIAARAGLPTTPVQLSHNVPEWMPALGDDRTLVLGVHLGAQQDGVDAALAYGLAHLQDQDLHLILPAGLEQTTLRRAAFLAPRVRVWIHDGYRIAPAPLPARDEVLTDARRDTWRLDHEISGTLADSRLGRAMTRIEGLDWTWRGTLTRTTETGEDHVDVARGHGDALRVVVDATDPDLMTVLHALDQWIFATANLGEIRSVVHDVPAHDWVMLTFVVASPDGDPAVHPIADVQVELLNHRLLQSQLLRVSRYNSDDARADVEMTAPLSTAPVTGERPIPRWPSRVQHGFAHHAGGWFWPAGTDGIVGSALSAYEELGSRGVRLETRYVASPHAFAVNLFGPLDATGVASLLGTLDMPVARAEPPALWWTDPDDRLREASEPGRETTRVDVLLQGVTADGDRVAALVAVKLTEEDFDECPAHQHAGNPRRSVCRTDAPFGGDPSACFQLRRRDAGDPSPRYPDVLSLPVLRVPDGGCSFRTQNEQMRYAALAAALKQNGGYAETKVVLCAPAFHEAIWRRAAEARRVLRAPGNPPLVDLPADLVLSVCGHPEAEEMRERYGLSETSRAV